MSRSHHSSFSEFFRKVLKRGSSDESNIANATRTADPHSTTARAPGVSSAVDASSSPIKEPQSEQLSELSVQSQLSTAKEPPHQDRLRPGSSTKSLAGSVSSYPSIAVDSPDATPSSTHVTIDNARLDSPPAPGSTISRNFADSASVRTIASSSRRRRSLDTNASTRAIAESVFSADSDHVYDSSKQ